MSHTITGYRVSSWLYTGEPRGAEYERRYGVEARVGHRRWVHVAENGTALIFETADEAEAAIKRFKAEPPKWRLVTPVEDSR